MKTVLYFFGPDSPSEGEIDINVLKESVINPAQLQECWEEDFQFRPENSKIGFHDGTGIFKTIEKSRGSSSLLEQGVFFVYLEKGAIKMIIDLFVR